MSGAEKAPERIWAWVYADPWGNELRWFEWENHEPESGDCEYIRADLVQAKDAESARLRAELATLRASEARLSEALLGLEKAATEVSRYGAQTGSQWSRLTVANLRARAALQGEPK